MRRGAVRHTRREVAFVNAVRTLGPCAVREAAHWAGIDRVHEVPVANAALRRRLVCRVGPPARLTAHTTVRVP